MYCDIYDIVELTESEKTLTYSLLMAKGQPRDTKHGLQFFFVFFGLQNFFFFLSFFNKRKIQRKAFYEVRRTLNYAIIVLLVDFRLFNVAFQ